MSKTRCVTIGGSSGAGKGVLAGAIQESLAQELGHEKVALYDTGATYRFAILQALESGAASEEEVVAFARTLIQQNDPLGFLEQFQDLWDNPERHHELRSQQISGLVAKVGWLDEAQYFFTDILNHRVSFGAASGIHAAIVDSRTPEVLLLPSIRAHIIKLAASIFMFTSSETAAKWASEKPTATKTYDELLSDLRKRNHDDAMRNVFPNFEPDPNIRTEISAKNIDPMTASFGSGIDLSDKRLYVINDGAIPIERIHRLGDGIARAVLLAA